MFMNKIRFIAVIAALSLAAPMVSAWAGSVAAGGLNDKVAKLTFDDLKRYLPGQFSDHTKETWGEIATVTVAGVEYKLPFIVQEDAVYTWHYMHKFLPQEVSAPPASGKPTDEAVLIYISKLAEAADSNANILIRKDFEANKAKYALLYPDAKGEEAVFTEVFDRYMTDENGKTAPEAQKAYNEFVALSMLTSALASYIQLKEKL